MLRTTQTVVRLLMAATPAQAQVYRDQINRFESSNPDIKVELLTVPYADFNDLLRILLEARYPLDAAVLSYNWVAQLFVEGRLLPLDERIPYLKDFVPDARRSNTFDGQLFGLPWVRSECLPHYRNLALFESSEHPQATAELLNFLIESMQQIETFIRLRWFPTRQSLYDQLGLECPLVEGIVRLPPEEVWSVIQLVNERSPNLEPLLEGQTLNAYESSAVLGSPAEAVASSVSDNIAKEDFEDDHPDGVTLGSLIAETDLDIEELSGNSVQLDPGDYVVQTVEDDNGSAICRLENSSNGQVFEVKWAVFDSLSAPTAQPSTQTQSSSSFEICWDINSRHCCIHIDL